jgi:sporulation-control protein
MMSLFNKMLASIGIGAAKVDTKLVSERITLGGEVKGVVQIIGGSVQQKIDEIYLSLYSTYTVEVNDQKTTRQALIEKWKITEPFTIGVNEKKEIPFSFKLPLDTPISVGKTRVWLHTGLDIKNAIDPADEDYIRIEPTPVMNAVLAAMEGIGFRLREADCEEAPFHLRGRLPFVQEFEYVPKAGMFRGKLDEVEVIFLPKSEQETEVLMQIDRRARGLGSLLAEALDLDESFVRFRVTNADIPNLREKLSTLIQRYC